MQGERWSILSPLLDELLELTGDARLRRLDEIKAAHPDLAIELDRLMALEEQRPDFLSEPVAHANLFSAQEGQEIGPYRLVSPLGEGGMGQVWLAMRSDGLYERRVALKLLRPGLGDVGLNARFTRERLILARLGHAHIARLLDAGISQDGQPYLALDYVRGDPITDYAQTRSLDLATRLQLFAQVCAAVSHAHANLVVHRDLKPSNILVTSAGEVCLLDFGIAKLLDQEQAQAVDITRTGSRTFTLHYAAPEQLRGEVITTMTDVYALGVVLYELLTDCKPYTLSRQSDAAWEEAILGTEPLRPSQLMSRKARESGSPIERRRARQLSGDLDNIVLKALNKAPEKRYASVEALAQDLRRHQEGQPVHARAQSLGYRARKYLRRHALGLAMGVGVSSVLAVALGIVSWQASRALREATRAQAMQDFVVALFENSGSAAGDERVDVRSLLDTGVDRADTELATQPQTRAELIGLIARLRSGLGDDAVALRLLDRQQAAIRSLGSRVQSSLLLESASLRGHSLRELGRNRECLSALEPVRLQVNESPGDDPLPTAEFLSQLGRCHAQLEHEAVARDFFTRALRLRRLHASGGAVVAESENDLAVLQIGSQPALAVRKLLAALAHLRASGGEQNSLGVELWRNLGAGYTAQGNVMEAEAAYRQALDISLLRFGSNHPRTTRVQQQLAEILVGTGKLEAAERLLALSQTVVQARWGLSSTQLAAQESIRGRVALERDQPDEADALLSDAVRIWRARRQLPAHAGDLCHLAQAQNELDRDGQAETTRQECMALIASEPLEVRTTVIAHIVQGALDRGDTQRAQKWLGAVPATAGTHVNELALLHARLAQRARLPAAAAQISQLLAGIPATLANRRLRWRVQALQASQLCLDGDPDAGLARRNATLAEANRMEPEHRRQQRRLLLLGAECDRAPSSDRREVAVAADPTLPPRP